jgi:hypothetical protein
MDSSAEVILRYSRSGGHKPPPDHESFELFKDGFFSLWRSIGSATYPPTPVGQFTGRLPEDDLKQINVEIARCTETGDLKVAPLPDASIETIQLAGVQANIFIHAEPPGAWGILAVRLREYLQSLTLYPLSAISIEVGKNGTSASLIHHGAGTTQIDFDNVVLRAVLWKGFRKMGDWFAPKGDLRLLPARLTAPKGWAFELPFGHGFNIQAGQEVVAYMNFTIYDGVAPVRISLESIRANRLD